VPDVPELPGIVDVPDELLPEGPESPLVPIGGLLGPVVLVLPEVPVPEPVPPLVLEPGLVVLQVPPLLPLVPPAAPAAPAPPIPDPDPVVASGAVPEVPVPEVLLPDVPILPEVPEVPPVAPDMPVSLPVPEVLEVPVLPGMPEAPEAPDVPVPPLVPYGLELPEVPMDPEAPLAPEVSLPVEEPLDGIPPLVLEPMLPLVPELPDMPVPEVDRGSGSVLLELLELWAKATPAVPIMEIRTAKVSFFMLSPGRERWIDSLRHRARDKC
jgi:hypothetical protein